MSEEMTAHGLLSHALRAHIDTVRKTMARVLATAPGRKKHQSNDAKAAEGESGSGSGSDEDAEEAVHDFRVGLRRLRTALRAARRIYGKKRLREISEGLKRYGDVTSALRDE